MTATTKGQIVQDLLRRFPNTASRTIATKAFNDSPLLFKDAEEARRLVRYYRGASGSEGRAECKDKSAFCAPRKSGDPFLALPPAKTHFDAWDAYRIQEKCKILVLPDIHLPYHDPNALALALRTGRERGATKVLLNGDTCDFFSVSMWEKDPRKRDLSGELEIYKHFFASLCGIFPKAQIVWKLGNHEERWERYLYVKAPELVGVEAFELEKVLQLPKDIVIVKDKRPIRAGKLNIIHGHEYRFNISNPVNPARGFFLRAKDHCLGSHMHQASHHSETTIEGKVISAWSTGCLCDVHPDYRPLNTWVTGFAFVELGSDGAFLVENFKIIDGKVYHS